MPAAAQSDDAAQVRELRQQLQALQRRLDALESAQRAAPAEAAPVAENARAAQRAAESSRAAAAEARAAAAEIRRNSAAAAAAHPATPRTPLLLAQPVPGDTGPARNEGGAAPQRDTPQGASLGTLPGPITIPGTNSTVRLYGFITAFARFDGGARNTADVITGQSIPLSNSPADRERGEFHIDSRRSRFALETNTPTSYGPLKTVIEMDFAGVQQTNSLTSQSTVSSFEPRLRHAYGELGPFLAGQYWTLWWERNVPQRFDFSIPVGQSSLRIAQFRYTHKFTDHLSLAGAVLNPYTDATLSTGTRFDDSDPLPTPNAQFAAVSRSPDIQAQLRWDDPAVGHIAVSGLLRPSIGITNQGSAAPGNLPSGTVSPRFERSTVGWGIQTTATARVGERDRAYLIFAYGGGIGRYLGSVSNGQAIVSNAFLPGVNAANVRVNEVKVVSASVGYTHWFTESIRSSVTMAWASLNYPSYVAQFANAGRTQLNRDIGQGSFNLLWSPIPRVDVGFEYVGSTRSLETPLTLGLAGGEGAKGGVSHRFLAGSVFRF